MFDKVDSMFFLFEIKIFSFHFVFLKILVSSNHFDKNDIIVPEQSCTYIHFFLLPRTKRDRFMPFIKVVMRSERHLG